MSFFPGSDRIFEEIIELFSLANALFVSKEFRGDLSACPYLAKGLEENGRRIIIEKLLSIAIKLRFMDDQCKLLAIHDRSNAGILIEKNIKNQIGLREALNKIIHHKSIEVFAQPSKITVTDQKTPILTEELKIAEGTYSGFNIFVRAEGAKGNQSWVFHTELTYLTNEILRVFYFDNLRDENSINNA